MVQESQPLPHNLSGTVLVLEYAASKKSANKLKRHREPAFAEASLRETLRVAQRLRAGTSKKRAPDEVI